MYWFIFHGWNYKDIKIIFLLDLIYYSLSLHWVGLGPPMFSWSCSQLWAAKSSFCHRPSMGDGILKAGHVQHQPRLSRFILRSAHQSAHVYLLSWAKLSFRLKHLQHLIFFAVISSKRCQCCLMIFTAVAGSEVQLKAQHFYMQLFSGLVVPCMQITPSL